jgi:hypothetical protein
MYWSRWHTRRTHHSHCDEQQQLENCIWGPIFFLHLNIQICQCCNKGPVPMAITDLLFMICGEIRKRARKTFMKKIKLFLLFQPWVCWALCTAVCRNFCRLLTCITTVVMCTIKFYERNLMYYFILIHYFFGVQHRFYTSSVHYWWNNSASMIGFQILTVVSMKVAIF